MTKLYIKQSVITKEEIQGLLDYQGKIILAGVVNSKNKGYDPSKRSTSLKQIDPKSFPSVNKKLIKLCKEFDPDMDPDKFYVKEYNFLIYNPGDHFDWHKDKIKEENRQERKYSSTTVLSLSDDLEGGLFAIDDQQGFQANVDIKLGETLLFRSDLRHRVFPVIKGKRIVLVAWIYNK